MQDFLLGDQGVPSGVKPYLFCDSTWLAFKTLQDPYQEADGDPVIDDSGNAKIIGDMPHMVEQLRLSAKALKRKYRHR